MTTTTQQYRITPLSELTLHPRNPRRSDTESLRESIRVNGFYGAVVAQVSTGYVLAGNHRVQAAQAEGIEEVPVTWVDVDDDTALRILLVDNRESDKAGYDDRMLLEILATLNEVDGLEGTGYDEDAVADLERITGVISDAATDFLRDLSDDYKTTDNPLKRDPMAERDPAVEMTQYFSLSYLLSFEDRELVVRALTHIREENGLDQSSEALIHLCTTYLNEHGIPLVPEPVDLDADLDEATEPVEPE